MNGYKYINKKKDRNRDEKLYWVCRHVLDHNVIDIGCGNGETAILLGREGFNVTAIDFDSESIKFANDSLSKEEVEVKKLVNFIHGNALTYDFGTLKFDTIIVENVIEHLSQPSRLYNKLYDLLENNGRVIITTPMGINANPNHKTTYFLSNFIEEVYPFFEVNKIDIIESHLCFIGKKRQGLITSDIKKVDINFIKVSDKFFGEVEKKLLNEIELLSSKISTLNQKITQLKNQQSLSNNSAEFDKLLNQYDELKEREFNLNKELTNHKVFLRNAISERDKVIYYFRRRVAVLEQSTLYRLYSEIKPILKKPWTLPVQFLKSIKVLAGAIKWKLQGKKRKYRLAPLPFELNFETFNSQVPIEGFQNSPFLSEDLNPLFLTGLYDSPKKLSELRVAAIVDDFTYESFRHSCELITFKPDNWLEVFTIRQPHLLFVESAWNGNGGSWQYKIGKYNLFQENELDAVLRWCSDHNIPTVFWNKEDPIHYSKFIDTAKKFDYIYTTDERCIPKYKEEVGHEKVYSLLFAAQPKIHNPIRVKGYKEENICFAGSYYANRHPERKKDLEEILDAAMPYNLVIYDRNYNKTGEGTEQFRFPERFKSNIAGALPYNKLVDEYKRFKIFINVNSIQDSKTMFSRRVFELLACGTSVVSTYAKGVQEVFGELVPMIQEDSNPNDLIERFLYDDNWRTRNELEAQRLIFSKHTYAHRLFDITQQIGFDLEKPYKAHVNILGYASNSDEVKNLYLQFNRQKFKDKTLFIFMDELNEELVDEFPAVTFIELKDGMRINDVQLHESGMTLISIFSPSNYYGPNYLIDSVNAYIYTDADVVGKSSYFKYDSNNERLEIINTDKENIYTDNLVFDALVINKESIDKYDLLIKDLMTNDWLKEYSSYGLRCFGVNPYNYIKGFDNLNYEEEFLEKVNL